MEKLTADRKPSSIARVAPDKLHLSPLAASMLVAEKYEGVVSPKDIDAINGLNKIGLNILAVLSHYEVTGAFAQVNADLLGAHETIAQTSSSLSERNGVKPPRQGIDPLGIVSVQGLVKLSQTGSRNALI